MEFWGHQNFGICKSEPNSLDNRGNKMSVEKTSRRTPCPCSALAGQGQQLSLFTKGWVQIPDSLKPHVRGLQSVGIDRFSKLLYFMVTIKTYNNNKECNSYSHIYLMWSLTTGPSLSSCCFRNLSWWMILQLTLWRYLPSKSNSIHKIQNFSLTLFGINIDCAFPGQKKKMHCCCPSQIRLSCHSTCLLCMLIC